MNSIERFYATIANEKVDRPACWLGYPTPEEEQKLCKAYGVEDVRGLKSVCGDDFYAVEIPYHSPTCNAIYAAFDWYMNGSNVDTEHRTLTADGCFADCEDIDDVKAVNFPWPDPADYIDPEVCRKLVDEAPEGKVIMGMLWACHFQDTCAAFGMQTALMNMVADPEMVHYVDDHIVAFYEKALRIYLEATKGKVHAILIGDDVGSQRGLMISPKLVSEFVIPGAKRLIDIAHSYGVKVVYHSCGSIVDAIPLLIEAGVDIIHPIQALAEGMQPDNLKAKFGGKVAFCGGVDTQDLLPYGTPEQVAAKVKELREIFPTGLIISPSHEALQADVPAENVKALFAEAGKIY
ncbi:MAG: methyltransferase [Clostridia bacterium]|nr:methyltransferase [Clostridia bacterium]